VIYVKTCIFHFDFITSVTSVSFIARLSHNWNFPNVNRWNKTKKHDLEICRYMSCTKFNHFVQKSLCICQNQKVKDLSMLLLFIWPLVQKNFMTDYTSVNPRRKRNATTDAERSKTAATTVSEYFVQMGKKNISHWKLKVNVFLAFQQNPGFEWYRER